MPGSHRVSVTSLHADNRINAEKVFRDEVTKSNQTITFCGVGTHHQNGVLDNHIGRMTRGARTNLLHAQRRWSDAIGESLWLYTW